MDYLNRLLWLKCRLNSRVIQGERSSALGLGLFFCSIIFSIIPMACSFALLVIGVDSLHARRLTHLALCGTYFLWIAIPILGYRINESFDISKLFIYPVSHRTLYVANFVGSFLDVSALLMVPPLVALALVHGGGPWGVIPPIFVVLVFLLHTVSFGQFFLFFFRHLLKHRRFWEFFAIALPIGMLLFIWGSQALVIAASEGAISEAPTEYVIENVTCLLPPGIAAEALIAFRDGDTAGALYWTTVLCAAAVVSLFAAAHVCSRMLQGAYDQWLSSSRNEESTPSREWLFPVLKLMFPRGSRVPAIAAREVKLIFREPQYRMIVLLYLLMFGILIAACLLTDTGEELSVMLEFLIASSVFFFGGLYVNALAVERTGLRLAISSPMEPFAYLGAKNVGAWIVTLSCVAVAVFASLLVVDGGVIYVGANFIFAATTMVVSAGFGNIVSVLCPIPLPTGGVAQRKPVSFGRVFIMSLLTGLAVSGCMVAVTPIAAVLVLGYSTNEIYLIARLTPYFFLYSVGLWGMTTLIAGSIFDYRRERLLPEILD